MRHIAPSRPNHIWGIDITYIRLLAGWLYLVAILDWYSRYVIAWDLSDTLDIAFVLACAQTALAQAIPQICNSDQGSHFTSPLYTDLLLGAGVQVSMDGRGRARDNIFTERLWRTVKYEEVYLTEYATPRQARHGLGLYFQFYNHQRPHQALDYRTPAAVYFGYTGQLMQPDRSCAMMGHPQESEKDRSLPSSVSSFISGCRKGQPTLINPVFVS